MSDEETDQVFYMGPYVAFLVAKISEILSYMNDDNYVLASRCAYNFTKWLDPEIKKKETIISFQERYRGLHKEMREVGGMSRTQGAHKRLHFMNNRASILLDEYIDIINDEIHEAGYFLSEKTNIDLRGKGPTKFAIRR